MASIKKTLTTNAGKDLRKDSAGFLQAGVYPALATWKPVWQFPHNVPSDPAIPLWSMCPLLIDD